MSGLGGFIHKGLKSVGVDSGPRPDGTRAMEAKQEAAGTKMQAVVRGRQGRNRASAESKSQVEAKRESAATKMQAAARGRQGRNRASAESKSQAEAKRESSATKLQAAIRGHQARNDISPEMHHQMLINKREANAKIRANDTVSPEVVRENRVKRAANLYSQKDNSWSMTARDYMPTIFSKKQEYNFKIGGWNIGRVAFSAFTKEGKEDFARGKEMAERQKGINSVIDHYAERAKTLATEGNSSENHALETKVATRAAVITASAVPGGQGAAPILNATGKAIEAGFHYDAMNKREESSKAYEKRSKMVGNKQLETPVGKALAKTTSDVLADRGEFQADEAEVSRKGVRSALVSGVVGGLAAGFGASDAIAHGIEQTNAAREAASIPFVGTALESGTNHANTPLAFAGRKVVSAGAENFLPKTAREQAASDAAPSQSWGEWASSVKRSITGVTINDTHVNPWYHLQSKEQKKVIDRHVFARTEEKAGNAKNAYDKRQETKMKGVRATENVEKAGKLADHAFTHLQRAFRAKREMRRTLGEADRPTGLIESHAHSHAASQAQGSGKNKSSTRSTSASHSKASKAAPTHGSST